MMGPVVAYEAIPPKDIRDERRKNGGGGRGDFYCAECGVPPWQQGEGWEVVSYTDPTDLVDVDWAPTCMECGVVLHMIPTKAGA